MKYKLKLNGLAYEVEVKSSESMMIQKFQSSAPAPADISAGEKVDFLMPDTILKVNVTAGQNVEEGDLLVMIA